MSTDRKRLEAIQFNTSMMDDSFDSLPDRVEAHLAGMAEIKDAYRETAGDEGALPEGFDNALAYATGYLYRTSNPDAGEDLKRHLANDLEYQAGRAKEGDWLPQSDGEIGMVRGLIELGSRLATQDKEPAFQPNSHSGRNCEYTDPYDVWYNKYGFLIPYSQTHGSYQ